jgi:large-conductance mechanosensitive channel
MNSFKKAWNAFQYFGLFIASIINFILLIPVYFIGVGISALFSKIAKKEVLPIKQGKRETYWREYVISDEKIEEHYRMF